MKVLMLNFEFPPFGGGAANANYYLIREFSRFKGLDIDLVTSGRRFQKEAFSKNITIYRLPVQKMHTQYWRSTEIIEWTAKAFFFVRGIVKEKRYDVCHTWFGIPTGVLGFFNRKRFPYIVALRGSDVPGYNPRFKLLDIFLTKHIARIVWKNARFVTSLSNDLSRLAAKTRQQEFSLIYNGIDIKEFRPIKKKHKGIKLITVGRLIERKGIIYILDALSMLIKRNPDVLLTIVGSGREEKRLKEFAEEKRLGKHVTFLGQIEHAKLPRIYSQNDIFVLASLNEALGNATHEAIASGLAIVTTDTGAAELLDNNGLVVKKEDPEDLREKIEYLIQNPDILKKFKNQSVSIAKKMSWRITAEQYLGLYEKCLK